MIAKATAMYSSWRRGLLSLPTRCIVSSSRFPIVAGIIRGGGKGTRGRRQENKEEQNEGGDTVFQFDSEIR